MARQHRLDGDAVEAEQLAAAAGDGPRLRLRQAGGPHDADGRRGPDHDGAAPAGDPGGVGHVIVVAVPDEDQVGPGERVHGHADGTVPRSAVEEGVEQDDVAA